MKFNKIFLILLIGILLSGILPMNNTVYAKLYLESDIKAAISQLSLSYDFMNLRSVIPREMVSPALPIQVAYDTDGTRLLKISNSFYKVSVKAVYNGVAYEFPFISMNDTGSGIEIVYDYFVNHEIYDDIVSLDDFDSVEVVLENKDVETLYEKDDGILETVEKLIAKLLKGVANAINKIVSWVLGQSVTIDDLVFNTYPDTKIEYFHKLGEQPANASKLIWGTSGDGVGGIYETVNTWYGYFMQIAIIAYMMMLVYMGVRIVLSSTGQKMAEYKNLFMYWCLGVVILFFYPYVMKYTIELNNAFVEIVSDSKDHILQGKTIEAAPLKPMTIGGSGGIEDTINVDFDSSPYVDGGNDYMSIIAKQANDSERLAVALTYIILTWQLITLIVHYYKRLLMTGFLIAIFPLVTVSYAIDRIADGKSQSFNKWNKEFILNVFIQSFHAIVYVFVCATVYAGGLGTGNYDYILIIVGVTFLFTGEEIIKKIFSQESPSGATSSLAATMVQTAAVAGLAKKAVTGVTKPFIGKDSVYNNVRNTFADMRASNIELGLFDRYAAAMQKPNAGLRLDGVEDEITRINNDTTMNEAQKRAARQRVKEVANAVADLNNPNTRSVEELARAQDIIEKAKRDPNYAHCEFILDSISLTPDQLDEISAIKGEVAGMIAGGVTDRHVVERHVKMRLGYVLDGMEEDSKEKYQNMVMANIALFGANRGFTRAGTESEIASMQADIEELSDSFTNIGMVGAFTTRQTQRRNDIISAAYDAIDDSEADAHTLRDLEYSKAVFNNRSAHLFTATEQMNALKTLRDQGDSSDSARAIVDSIDEDVDVSLHILAKKVLASTSSSDAERREAQTILDEYEGTGVDLRAGYSDDEIAIHEVIAKTGDATEEQDMLNSIHTARRRTNHAETILTEDMFTDILYDNDIDIEEGAIDTETRYFNGKTREQIIRERRNRNIESVRRMAGFKGGTYLTDSRVEEGYEGADPITRFFHTTREYGRSTGTVNKDYLENRRRYNAHFEGDRRD